MLKQASRPLEPIQTRSLTDGMVLGGVYGLTNGAGGAPSLESLLAPSDAFYFGGSPATLNTENLLRGGTGIPLPHVRDRKASGSSRVMRGGRCVDPQGQTDGIATGNGEEAVGTQDLDIEWEGELSGTLDRNMVCSRGSADGWQLRVGSATQLKFLSYDGGWTSTNVSHGASVGDWVRIKIERRGAVWTLFVNGSSVGSAAAAADIATTTESTEVGSRASGSYYDYKIAEVKITVAGTVTQWWKTGSEESGDVSPNLVSGGSPLAWTNKPSNFFVQDENVTWNPADDIGYRQPKMFQFNGSITGAWSVPDAPTISGLGDFTVKIEDTNWSRKAGTGSHVFVGKWNGTAAQQEFAVGTQGNSGAFRVWTNDGTTSASPISSSADVANNGHYHAVKFERSGASCAISVKREGSDAWELIDTVTVSANALQDATGNLYIGQSGHAFYGGPNEAYIGRVRIYAAADDSDEGDVVFDSNPDVDVSSETTDAAFTISSGQTLTPSSSGLVARNTHIESAVYDTDGITPLTVNGNGYSLTQSGRAPRSMPISRTVLNNSSTQYVALPDLTDAATKFEFYIKTTDNAGIVVAQADASGNFAGVWADGQGTSANADNLYVDGVLIGVSPTRDEFHDAITDGERHHVVFERNTAAWTAIGLGIYTSSGFGMAAEIADFKVYHGATLQAHLPLQGDVRDISGNGNHGTLTNATGTQWDTQSNMVPDHAWENGVVRQLDFRAASNDVWQIAEAGPLTGCGDFAIQIDSYHRRDTGLEPIVGVWTSTPNQLLLLMFSSQDLRLYLGDGVATESKTTAGTISGVGDLLVQRTGGTTYVYHRSNSGDAWSLFDTLTFTTITGTLGTAQAGKTFDVGGYNNGATPADATYARVRMWHEMGTQGQTPTADPVLDVNPSVDTSGTGTTSPFVCSTGQTLTLKGAGTGITSRIAATGETPGDAAYTQEALNSVGSKGAAQTATMVYEFGMLGTQFSTSDTDATPVPVPFAHSQVSGDDYASYTLTGGATETLNQADPDGGTDAVRWTGSPSLDTELTYLLNAVQDEGITPTTEKIIVSCWAKVDAAGLLHILASNTQNDAVALTTEWQYYESAPFINQFNSFYGADWRDAADSPTWVDVYASMFVGILSAGFPRKHLNKQILRAGITNYSGEIVLLATPSDSLAETITETILA